MVYKYISCKRVIAKVFSDLDLQEGNQKTTDMIEWIGEALLKIGAFPMFVNKVTGRDNTPYLEIANYQAILPSDFHSLIQINYATTAEGPFYPMRQGTGSFDYNPSYVITDTTEMATEEVIVVESDLITLAMQVYSLTYEEAVVRMNTDPVARSILISMLVKNITTTPYSQDYTYVIQGNYIKTNVATGYVMMAYQAVPTDVEGYPLIPDNESIVEALYWYVVMKLYYPQWVTGQIRDAVYADAKKSWNYYCKQAYGSALMPDRGLMESIKNSWLRLMPNVNEMDTDFVNLGEQQVVYTHST